MTNDQIIELAKQAGFLIDEAPISQPYVIQPPHYKVDDELRRFAELVRNQTLEEAAKVCVMGGSMQMETHVQMQSEDLNHDRTQQPTSIPNQAAIEQ